MQIKTKLRVADILLFGALLSSSFITPVSAANIQPITAVWGSADCTTSGYFSPATTTIDSGDTVSFYVSATDADPNGVIISGLPGGDITLLPGTGAVSAPITTDVSFSGVGASAGGCSLGGGSISVNTPPTTVPVSTAQPQSGNGASSATYTGVPTAAPRSTATAPSPSQATPSAPTTAPMPSESAQILQSAGSPKTAALASSAQQSAAESTSEFNPLPLVVGAFAVLVLAGGATFLIIRRTIQRRYVPAITVPVPVVAAPVKPLEPIVFTPEPIVQTPVHSPAPAEATPARPAAINPYTVRVQ